MAVTTYYPGDVVRIKAVFTDPASGLPATPTSVDVIPRSPTRASTTVAATNDGGGIWHADITVDQPGQWAVQVKGKGTVARSTIIRFDVLEGV